MQFGIVSIALGTSDYPECFARAAKIGLQGIEFFYWGEQGVAAINSNDHADLLNELKASSGVSVPSLCLSALGDSLPMIGKNAKPEESKQHCLRAIELAGKVGAGVILVPFFGRNTIESEAELRQACDALMELAEPAEQAGVVLGVESPLNFNQQQFVLEYTGQTPAIRIYGDTGNALARKMDPATGIRDLGEGAVVQMHIKDVRLAEGQPPSHEIDLGEGSVDFRAVAQALQAVKYAGWLVLETPGGADPIASAKKNLQFTRNIFAS